MAAESIGNLVPTKIPGYSDAADIQAALRLYHYGSYTYDTTNTDVANLVNPSIAYTLNSLQTQINSLDLGISANTFNAKGDILSASADNTPAILSAGSNGKYLITNSATSTGLEWSSLPTSSTAAAGIVQLTDSTSSTSTTTAATPNSVKTTYDAMLPKSTITTQGDIIVGNSSGQPVRLAKGSSGYVLTVNPLAPNGISWSEATGSGGMAYSDLFMLMGS